MRISQKNGYCKRSQDREQTPSPRTQKPYILGFTFPKKARIRTRRHYQRIYQEGRKLVGDVVGVDLRLGPALHPKLGITVSKRHGKAHDRNYFKRVVREAFRHSYGLLPVNMEINVFPRQPLEKITKAAVQADLARFAEKIK
jgi:ribonuclease P protein component